MGEASDALHHQNNLFAFIYHLMLPSPKSKHRLLFCRETERVAGCTNSSLRLLGALIRDEIFTFYFSFCRFDTDNQLGGCQGTPAKLTENLRRWVAGCSIHPAADRKGLKSASSTLQ